jgi:putative addiction module component (TIGR02574 family)
MDLKTVLTEVQSWPPEDRLRLIEEVWDGLADEGHEPELTPELKDLLDNRLAALDADPDNVVTWEEIKAVHHTKRDPRRWQFRA